MSWTQNCKMLLNKNLNGCANQLTKGVSLKNSFKFFWGEGIS